MKQSQKFAWIEGGIKTSPVMVFRTTRNFEYNFITFFGVFYLLS